ncbi:DUF4837 family protein [Balneolaceae bacterium ANBcel3]|nr:DUF4837 family protein [Balneolaceae bacterium ANBcel3]
MKSVKWLLYAPVLFAILILSGCDGDYRKSAQGGFSEILVVMDSDEWDGPVAEAIRETFGEERMTLPRPEAKYDLRFMDIKTTRDLEFAKSFRNTIFAAPIDEQSNVADFIRAVMSEDIKTRIEDGRNFAFPLKDRWFRDQWTLFLSSGNEEALANKIRQDGSSLVQSLDQVERERWTREVYRRGEQEHLADSLREKLGFGIRVQHDYRLGVDTTGFVSMRRFLHDNDRWIWFAYKEDISDKSEVTEEWIHAVRDSLNRSFIRGTREDSYITTEYRRAIETRNVTMNGYPALETRGTWTMVNDLMGGPFLNYVVFDEEKERVYMMEFAQFAPRYSKRRFMNQFEAMAYTFHTDREEDS